MPERRSTRLLELFIIPLIVGSIIAVFTYGLPRIYEDDKELSYTIKGPTKYLDEDTIGSLTVEVDGIPTSKLFAYEVKIWNSGDLPMTNVPVRFVFETDNEDFRVFSIIHNTKPTYEFGNIMEQEIDNYSMRFVYELLNPNDEDTITFLTNESPEIRIYSKMEGMKVKWVKPEIPIDYERIGIIFSVLGSLIAVFFTIVFEKMQKKD